MIKMLVCRDPHDSNLYENLLNRFSETHHKPVQASFIPWESAKQELLAITLYGKSMDLSEIGASAVSDLIAMDALRSFSKAEIDYLGGTAAFPPIAWNLNSPSETDALYAIPSVLDGRALIYWRDMFETAGVNETSAFNSFDNLEQALALLQKAGVHAPFAMGTADKFITFQTACTWLWGLGVEIGKDREVLFDSPEAIDAFLRFFSMYRFMPSNRLNPNLGEARSMFKERKVAVIMDSVTSVLSGMSDEDKEKIGVALAPGPTYVGSTKLVIWRNSHQVDAALSLIRYITSHECQVNFPTLLGFMPARISALRELSLGKDQHMQIISESILQGRSYANLPLSYLVEDILATAISNVWRKLITDPGIDTKSILLAELAPVARRIRMLWEQ